MIAQFINENINFERSKDPKKSMKIGQASLPVNLQKKFSEIKYHLVVDTNLSDDQNIVFYIEGKEFLDSDKNRYYFALSPGILSSKKEESLLLWKVENNKFEPVDLFNLNYSIEWDTDINKMIKDMHNKSLNKIHNKKYR